MSSVAAKNQKSRLVIKPSDTKNKVTTEKVEKSSFDYCEDVARVNEDDANVITEAIDIIKEEPTILEDEPPDIATEIVEDDDLTECGESSTTVSNKTPNGASHTLCGIEANFSSLQNNEIDLLVKPSNDEKSSTSTAEAEVETNINETFFNAFEIYIKSRSPESQCNYTEAYGFVITFRYVYELKERDKDTEQAINALIARYTGIESLNVLQVFLESLNANRELDNFYSQYGISPVDCILLTYIQLRVCISFRDLAKIFETDLQSVQACFISTINKIRKTLGSVIYWPSREETEMTIPKFFKPAYSNVRTIFTNLLVQKNEFHQERYVIGFSPSGFVSYVSNGYNAATYSDERIFREEKIRQRFERNQDALMVLEGFPIENLLGINNFRVFRPPFLVKTILPDNKSRIYENTALYRHCLGFTTIFEKFLILSCKNLSYFIEELVYCVCVCNNYNILFRNT